MAVLPAGLQGQEDEAFDLVPADAVWRYALAAPEGWAEVEFDDSGWSAGAAQLGFGDGDERTVIRNAPQSHITYYFRHTFETVGVNGLRRAIAHLVRDDGALVYLNGQLVASSNMGFAPLVTPESQAASRVTGADETVVHEYQIPVARFNAGTNVLAAEVHQFGINSRDLSFELRLAVEGEVDRVLDSVSRGGVRYDLLSSPPRVEATEEATGNVLISFLLDVMRTHLAVASEFIYVGSEDGVVRYDLEGAGRTPLPAEDLSLFDPAFELTVTGVELSAPRGLAASRTIGLENKGKVPFEWSLLPVANHDLEDVLAEILARGDARFGHIPGLVPFSINSRTFFPSPPAFGTDLMSRVPLTDGILEQTAHFGVGGRHFSIQLRSLFALSADLDGLEQFRVAGTIQGDEGTIVRGELQSRRGDHYRAFFKRLTPLSGDRANQIVVFENAPEAFEDEPFRSWNFGRIVSGLGAATRLHVLIFFTPEGREVSDGEMVEVMDTYLAVAGTPPPWLSVSPAAGSLPPGAGTAFELVADGSVVADGSHFTRLDLEVSGNESLDREEIEVRFEVPESPIVLDPVDFEVERLANEPYVERVEVVAANPGAVEPWVVSTSFPGASVFPESGVTPGAFTLSFDTVGQPPGSYEGTFEISSGEVHWSVGFAFEVNRIKELYLVPDPLRERVYATYDLGRFPVPQEILVFDTSTGSIVGRIEVGDFVSAFAVEPGGRYLYLCSLDMPLRIGRFDLESGGPPVWTEFREAEFAGTAITQFFARGGGELSFLTGTPGRLWKADFGEGQVVDSGWSFGRVALAEGWREGFGWIPFGTAFPRRVFLRHALIDENPLAGEVSRSRQIFQGGHPPPVCRTQDGSRVFCGAAGYSVSDLSFPEVSFGGGVLAVTPGGEAAFGASAVFNAVTGETLGVFPFSAETLALSSDGEHLLRFDEALGRVQVEAVSDFTTLRERASQPSPSNGVDIAGPLVELGWSADLAATAFDVFLGRDRGAVDNAVVGGDEHAATTVESRLDLTGQLVPGETYYWRVDQQGYRQRDRGEVWSFRLVPFEVSPPALRLHCASGLPSEGELTLASATGEPLAWTAQSEDEGVARLEGEAGSMPGVVRVSPVPTSGTASGAVTIRSGGFEVRVPVSFRGVNLALSQLVADPARPRVYGLHPGADGGESTLAVIESDSGVVSELLPLEGGATKVALHPGDDRLYLADPEEEQIRMVDLERLVEGEPLRARGAVVDVAAGGQRLLYYLMEGWDDVFEVDTRTGAVLRVVPMTTGARGLATDPEGRWLLSFLDRGPDDFADNVFAYILDRPWDDSRLRESRLLSFNRLSTDERTRIVVSRDGTRVFINGIVLTTDPIDFEASLGLEVLGAVGDGSVVFGEDGAFDLISGRRLLTFPFSTRVLVGSGDGRNAVLFNPASGRLTSIPLPRPPDPPELDSDNDGVPDRVEAVAGTDIADPASTFRLTVRRTAGVGFGRFSLSWPGAPGRRYKIQFKNALTDPSWIDLAEELLPAAEGEPVLFTDVVTEGQRERFYRVTVRLD